MTNCKAPPGRVGARLKGGADRPMRDGARFFYSSAVAAAVLKLQFVISLSRGSSAATVSRTNNNIMRPPRDRYPARYALREEIRRARHRRRRNKVTSPNKLLRIGPNAMPLAACRCGGRGPRPIT